MDYEALLRNTLYKYIVDNDLDGGEDFSKEKIITVWFNKILQNAKGLFIIKDYYKKDYYFEVTFNGNEITAYVDMYQKVDNQEVKLND